MKISALILVISVLVLIVAMAGAMAKASGVDTQPILIIGLVAVSLVILIAQIWIVCLILTAIVSTANSNAEMNEKMDKQNSLLSQLVKDSSDKALEKFYK